MEDDTICKLLHEIAIGNYIVEVTISVRVETWVGIPVPHIVLIHSLGLGPCFKVDGSEVIVYV